MQTTSMVDANQRTQFGVDFRVFQENILIPEQIY
jgi:hypothetical protein